MRKRILTALLFLLVLETTFGQSFDGSVTYRFKKYEFGGTEGSFPLKSQEVFFSEDKILFVPQSNMAPLGSVLIDATLNKRYEINHEEKTVYVLKEMEINNAPITYTEQKDTVSTILGVACILKEIKRFNEFSRDTVTSLYWLAPSMPIANIHKYAVMQGYNNTLILDGSMGYVPLKVEVLMGMSGERIIIEAQAIKTEALKEEVFALPEYLVRTKDF